MAKIDVTLTVKENSLGKGNTSDGNYDYTFVPDLVHVTEADTEIVYSLAGDEQKRFAIEHIYTVDVKEQLGKPARSDDDTTISIRHKNTHRQLIVVSIRVRDRHKDRHIGCDPQVTNDPPPVVLGH